MEQIKDEYTGYFAEFYDILHRGAPEVPFLTTLAREHGGRLLEFGCGTGRLLLPLAEEGLSVVGIDFSPDMLAICRKKLVKAKKAVRDRVELIDGNMTAKPSAERFDVVALACNTYLHATTHEAQIRMLTGARKRLRPGGVCFLDISVPTLDDLSQAHGRTETFVFYDPDRKWMVIDRFCARFDLGRQIENDEIQLTCVRDGKAELRLATKTRLAVVFPREVFHAARAAGFTVLGAFTDYAGTAWKAGRASRNLILVLGAPDR